jgi:hypothetical protein
MCYTTTGRSPEVHDGVTEWRDIMNVRSALLVRVARSEMKVARYLQDEIIESGLAGK